MTGSRLKRLILVAGIVLNALVVLAWTQQWISTTLDEGQVLSVGGDVAAPAASTLALSGLVLIGALAIAGPFFRVVLGVLQALLGMTIVLSSVIAIASPVAASGPLVAEATGVTGTATVEGLVSSAVLTLWPWVASAAGVLLMVLGVLTVATARRWPGSTRKYSAVRTAAVDGGDPVHDWDALSSGDDPTQPPQPSR